MSRNLRFPMQGITLIVSWLRESSGFFPQSSEVIPDTSDFRILAKGAKDGNKLSKEDTEHLMSLFGTFPPDVESEP
jgi:hypothetical protein